MQKHEEFIKEANKIIQTADHLAYVTYPMIKETKLLLTITQNIHNSLLKTMDSILEYEKLYKYIPEYHNDLSTKLEILKTKCVNKYSLPKSFIQIIRETRMILDEHEKSSVEFSKHDKLIICSNDFQTRSINLIQIKSFLLSAKQIIEASSKIVSKK